MKQEYFRLPNGEITTDINLYADSWSSIGERIAKFLDCDIIGYDPGIHLIEKGSSTGFTLSVGITNKILDNIK